MKHSRKIPFYLLLIAIAAGLLMIVANAFESPPALPAVQAPVQTAVAPAPLTAAGTISSDRLTGIPYTLPAAAPSDVVILFTDPAHPEQTNTAVERLTGLGAAVAVIDTVAYLKALAGSTGDCLWLSSEVEGLNRNLQRKLGFSAFRLPVLASLGEGGAVVYALLIEAPSYSFAGGVSAGFTPTLTLPSALNFCGGPVLTPDPANPSTFTLGAQDTAAPWNVIPASGQEDKVGDWIGDVDRAEAMPLAKDGPLADPVAALVDAVTPMLAGAAAVDANSLSDLPLIEMPPQTPQPYFAIIYSGDGGWRDLDRTLGQVLASNGVPVVGVDSLLYFWRPKHPQVVAHDLDRIIAHYREAWHIDKVVVIGYSFGADILPFAYNRLPDDTKTHIAELSLLGLSRNTRFEISIGEYFDDSAGDETRLVAPELTKIAPGLLQCFYGEDEADDSACTMPEATGFEIVKTPGGHHFGDDYNALAQRIMTGATDRLNNSKSLSK